MADDPAQAADEPLQILLTLHQVSQSARGSTVFETSGRATVFLTTVSSSLVALGFIAQATQMSGTFYLFAYLILGGLVFVGWVTFVRLVQCGNEDVIWARSIGRILHHYVERRPQLAAYLVQDPGDDAQAVLKFFGRKLFWQPLFSSGSMAGVVTAAIAGVLAGLALRREADLAMSLAVLAGATVFAAGVALCLWHQHRSFQYVEQMVPSRFPTPRTEAAPPPQ